MLEFKVKCAKLVKFKHTHTLIYIYIYIYTVYSIKYVYMYHLYLSIFNKLFHHLFILKQVEPLRRYLRLLKYKIHLFKKT